MRFRHLSPLQVASYVLSDLVSVGQYEKFLERLSQLSPKQLKSMSLLELLAEHAPVSW